MREYSKVSPQFWIGHTGRQIRKLGIEARAVAAYLLTAPQATMIGIYYLPIAYIAHELDIPIEGASKTLQSLCNIGFCTYDPVSEYIWIFEMAVYQVGKELDPRDKRVKGIQEIYWSLPNLPFLKEFFEKYHRDFHLETCRENNLSEAPSKSLRCQEQEQEQNKDISMSGEKSPDVSSLEKNTDEEKQNEITESSSRELKRQAIEILEFLNKRTGRVYRPVDTNLKLIIARLKSGATPGQCRQVIIRKTREWQNDARMVEYLRPATLFNATKFEQYVGELVVSREVSAHESNH